MITSNASGYSCSDHMLPV